MVSERLVVTGRLLTFCVDQGRFAILLDEVLGVQNSTEKGSGRDVLFQGQPVAAVDARGLLWSGSGRPARTEGMSHATIFVCSGGPIVALLVDRVEGIVEGVEMQQLPALVTPFVKNVFRGVTLHADGSRLVVDPAALSRVAAVGGQRGPGEA